MEYKSMSSSGFYFKCSVLLRFFLCYNSNPPANDLLGAWAFRVMPLSSTGRSQDNSRGYQCCTSHSKYDFLALSRAPLPMPSLPWISCSTIPNLHLPQLCSSPLIRTTFPGFTVASPVLRLRLWCCLNALRYSVVHLDQRTSLGCFRYFAHLRLTSLNSFCLLLL